MKFINLTLSLVLTLILASFASVTMAQDEPCFTLKRDRDCGTAGTGSTLTCEDGSSGPSFIRVAPATYVCQSAPRGSGGRKGCDNTGGKVHETLTTYSCASGTYSTNGPQQLSTCFTATLSGIACEGTATPNASAMEELLFILDSFE